MDATAANDARDRLPFAQHHAFIIGINTYAKVSHLQTAVEDAQQLAIVLGAQQHFLVHGPLLDATGADIRTLLQTTLPAQVGKDDRVVFYFAGHGIALDGDDGPAGYIVPADADPADVKTLIPMADLQKALDALPCRHLLLVLDCCFSGAFKWSTQYRAIGTLMPKRIYKERFDRFIHDPAWQVITSAAYDQKALDVVHGQATGARGVAASADQTPHSPFAQALFDGLAGAADAKGDVEGDGVITATELYAYIRDEVEPETIAEDQRLRQTPGFFPLPKHDKGEFIFLHPHHRLNLPPIPNRSPYKGLESFNEDDRLLFYGRDRVIKDLRARAENSKLLVLSGASGTGKSSVIKAGLLPVLRAAGYGILPVIRPGTHPLAALEQALQQAQTAAPDAAGTQPPGTKFILLIDQFEELITRCTDQNERQQFEARLRQLLDEDPSVHRIILTVRADFEPQLNSGVLQADWAAGRCTVPPFSLEELKEVIVLPTIQEVLIFDPPQLVDEIIEEVVQSPGALPLLSYALSELYEAYRRSGRQDRALRKADYDTLGGVMGALRTKADALYQSLTPAEQDTMRKVMLRMVSVEGDLASKRVLMHDLVYSDADKPHVDKVVEQLVEARLVVKGQDYIEPAHDALVRAWKRLHDWVNEAGKDQLILGARLGAAANEFGQSGNSEFLWDDNPNLPVVEKALKHPLQWFNAKEIAFIAASARRKRRRRAWLVGTTAAVIAALSLATWYSLAQAREARRQRVVASDSADRARAELRRSVSLRVAAEAPAVLQGDQVGSHERAVQQLLAAHLLNPDSVQVDGALLSAVSAWPLGLSKVMEAGVIHSVAVSRDGSLIATGGVDGAVRLWDGKNSRPIGPPLEGPKGPVWSVAFGRDGSLVSGSDDGSVWVWEWDAKRDIEQPIGRRIDGGASDGLPVYSVAFNADGSRIISAGADGFVRLWDAKNRDGHKASQIRAFSGASQYIHSAALSPDSSLIVSVGGDDTLRLWDGGNRPIVLAGKGVASVAFSPDGARIVSGGDDGTLRLWDARSHKLLRALEGHKGPVESVAFSPDGSRIVSAGEDGTLQLWNARTPKWMATLNGHKGRIRGVTFSADGSRIVSGGDDGTLRVWDATSDPSIATANSGRNVALSPDGSRIISRDGNGALWLREANGGSGTLLGPPLEGDHDLVVATNDDGSRVVVAGNDGALRLWDAESGKLRQIRAAIPDADGAPAGFHDGSRSLAVSRDGSRVVSGDIGGTLWLWDANVGSGRELNAPDTDQQGTFTSVAMSPDGLRIASGDATGKLQWWDSEKRQRIGAPIEACSSDVDSLAFSPDGTRIVSGCSFQGRLQQWDATTLAPHGPPLPGHFSSVAFSHDRLGSRIVSGGEDGTLQLWDSASGQPLGRPIKGGHVEVHGVAFNRDDSVILALECLQDVNCAGNGEGTVRSWPGPAAWVDTLCAKLSRNMTRQQWKDWISPEIEYEKQCPSLPDAP
jgi:WD40 repeat protein